MKSRTVFGITIPRGADGIPEIKADGTYVLTWTLPNRGQVQLIFEDGRPVHEIFSRIIAMETMKRQAAAKHV
jgi:hypothetical protein